MKAPPPLLLGPRRFEFLRRLVPLIPPPFAHPWSQLGVHNVYVLHGFVDPAGDVIIAGPTNTGLPGMPPVSSSFYLLKLSRASSRPLALTASSF